MSVDEHLAAAQRAEAARTHYQTIAAAPASKKPSPAKSQKNHLRNGDRADRDDDDAPPSLPIYCRFHDLKQANIVRSWPQIMRLIRSEGFPRGLMISSHSRVWNVRDVLSWLSERPTANTDVRLRGKRALEVETLGPET
jgi:hypothetical protein